MDHTSTAHTQKGRLLPPDAENRVILEARKEGVFAGLTSGLASAVIGSRLMRFSRNTTIFCGVLTGLLSGYLFTQAFTDTATAQLRAEQTRQTAAANETAVPSNSSNPSRFS